VTQQSVIDMYEYTNGRSTIDLHRAKADELRRSVKPWLEHVFKRQELVGVLIPRPYHQTIRVPKTEAPPPPPPEPQRATETKPTWIKIRVVEDETDRPLSGVELDVRLTKGEETTRATKSSGLIDIVDVEAPGSCSATSIIKDAEMKKFFIFVAVADKPTKQSEDKKTKPAPPAGARIGLLVEHKVRNDDTLGTIAKYYGLNWRELAQFNWGTSDPEKINEHLRDDVGSTKKTASGKNYILSSSDDPGIIYVPKKWSGSGFETEKTHTVRVKPFEKPFKLFIFSQ
ncbi:MAG: LysM peptidoglycan-binding domain-containing protein, partial [Pyrinomonadaceae bacterium]